METVTRTEVEINDIFEFAKKEFEKSWNDCGYLFHRTEVLPFIGHKEFYRKELAEKIKYCEDDKDENRKLAYEIILGFMKKHNLEEMYYVGNGN